MATEFWLTKRLSITALQLDSKNPRIGRNAEGKSPREIIQYLFDNDKAYDVAESIALRGYFPNEPLLAIKEDNSYVVIEGNRRLAALKALKEPQLLEGAIGRKVERLARSIANPISRVPVTIAPSRKEADKLLVGRHIGTPVMPWKAENRATFILEKLEEGYTNEELLSDLNFSAADIQNARLTRAIADVSISLDLPDEVRTKLISPRAQVFTTLKRVFDSTVGRKYLKIVPDQDHGFVGQTNREEFASALGKLVGDIVSGDASSRKLNKNSDIEKYFKKWNRDELPRAKGNFVPSDLIKGMSRVPKPKPSIRRKRPKQLSSTVVPSSLRVIYGNERLVDILRELKKLRRQDFPNAGAVLLRVFFELTVIDYLERTGEMAKIVEKIEKKGGKLKFGKPILSQLTPEILRIAKKRLPTNKANQVEKAIRYDPSAPFTISELHAFVHSEDFPSERDIQQFWMRTEPLFRLILEEEPPQ